MTRYTAAALLTDDVRIVTDFLVWLRGQLDGRVSPSVITTSAHVLAKTLEPETTAGAALLSRAAVADQLRPAPRP